VHAKCPPQFVNKWFLAFNLIASSYSCWSIFAIPYNLPLALCMKYEFIFLCIVIPSLDHLGTKIDVMMRPLIKELKILWDGVQAYDCYKKQKFNLRAVYLWSIHDFMAYGIFGGWSCQWILTCPIYAKYTLCFRLKFSGKICYFDCHRCFLPQDPFRFERNAFKKDVIVTRGSPKRLSGP
jgi:hypothetical protein